MPLYVALLEVEPVVAEALGEDSAGAFVRVYVVAESEELAMVAIGAALPERGVRLVDVDWIVDDAGVEWENPESAEGERLRLEARTGGDVTFDVFHTWSHGSEE